MSSQNNIKAETKQKKKALKPRNKKKALKNHDYKLLQILLKIL